MVARTIAGWTAFLCCAFAACAPAAFADAQLDPSFGTGGRLELSLGTGSGADGVGYLLPNADGGFLAVGAGKGIGIWVTQHLPNGALDGSFGAGGGIYFPQKSHSFAGSAVRQPDGSIVLAGGEDATEFDTLVARLTPQGALDPTFGNDAPHPKGDGISVFDLGGDDIANGVALTPGGQILVAGRTGSYPSLDVLLARLNPDGSIDTTFGGPKGVHTNLGGNDSGRALALQGARILVLASSGNNAYVLGYRQDGTLDPTFGGGDGIATVAIPGDAESGKMVVQPDGRIVVADSHSKTAYIARLQPDGSPDTSFGTGGVTSFEVPAGSTGQFLDGLAQGDDGKIVAATNFYGPGGNTTPVLLRTLANGQPDPAWGTGGVLTFPPPPEVFEYFFAVAIDSKRRVLTGGDIGTSATDDRVLVRVLGDTTPPDTAITTHPKKKQRVSKRPLRFAFEAVGDVNTTFECQLTRPKKHKRKRRHHRSAHSAAAKPPAFAPCASPLSYKHLRRPGRYRFAVRSIDPAGNVDPTPATATFKLLPKRHKHHAH